MPRAPVLPSVAEAARRSGSPVFAGDESSPPVDDYAARLVKYIPGEVIPFFIMFASIGGVTDGQLIAALAVGESVALLWAIDRNGRLDGKLQRPRGLVVLWSLIAFPAWALGTSPATQQLLGWPAVTCALILAATALLIPYVDDMLAGLILSRRGDEGNDD